MQRINLLSYHCSGLSGWSINCLTELKVMNMLPNWTDIFRFSRKIDDLFDEYECFEDYKNLSLGFDYFPAVFFRLMRKEPFVFRNDVMLSNTCHNLLSSEEAEAKNKSIIAIRDPRDNMISAFRYWRYWGHRISFDEFCIKQIRRWINYYEHCLKYKKTKIFRFEDRKKDELSFLKEFISFMEIDYSDSELAKVLLIHSVENAKKYDEEIKRILGSSHCHIESGELARHKSPQNHHYKKAFDYIIAKAAPTMKKYGYTDEQICGDKFRNLNQIKRIFAAETNLPAE